MVRPLGIAPVEPPRLEGTVPLPDGRQLGYAEYGDPAGKLILWFHGTPGARRQFPPGGREAARRLGLRVVVLERPGVGRSTDHHYRTLTDFAPDVAVVADRLGHERFMIVGLSGGGPYALACAHELPDRVLGVGLLGSLVPTAGEDAVCKGIVAMAQRFHGPLVALRRPLGAGLWGFMRVANPLSHLMVVGFARMMPEGDRRVLGDRILEGIFVDDITVGSRHQFRAVPNDIVLIGQPWGFRLRDVKVPVRWWHGDADPFVPLDQAERAAAMLPDVELHVRENESHLGDWAAAAEVLDALATTWSTA